MRRIQIYTTLSVILLISMSVAPIGYTLANSQLNVINAAIAQADATILWEDIGLPEYMDPHKNYEAAGSWIHYNIYETLFTYPWDTAETSPSVGLLAESLTISSDGLTYTFTLREGVTFHDGTDFNATAAQMNFWRMLGRGWDDGWGPVWMIAEPILGGSAVEDAVYTYGEGSPEHIAAWENWKDTSGAVVVNSEFELEVNLAYAYTPFLAALTYEVGAMISPTFFMAHGGMSPASSDYTLNEEACGTGPYKLVDWIQDDRIELTLNENYWREDAAQVTHPNAGSITDITIKLNTDVNSRMLNLETGTSDGCYWPATNAYDIWNGEFNIGDGTLQSLNPDIKVWAGNPTFDVMFLGFNMNPYLNVSNDIRQSPFTDWELRAAISYAFDYESLIDNILNGLGIQLQGPIPQGMFGHDDDLFMFEQDMTEAVTHWNLAMANGLDDVWANNSYELNIYYNEGNTNREAAGLLVKQAIEEIIADPASTNPSSTLTIDVQSLEWASYLYQVRNKQLPIFWLGWAPDYADPDNYATPFVKSTGSFPNRVGLAGSTGEGDVVWDGATVDGWIDAAAVETNEAVRIALYADIQEAIVDHCAFLWGYQATSFHVENADMNGYVFNPMHDPYFYHYWKGEGVTTTTSTMDTTTDTNPTGFVLPSTEIILLAVGVIAIIAIGVVFISKRG
jgi:peptide/nickel transport system substrate-binding protein